MERIPLLQAQCHKSLVRQVMWVYLVELVSRGTDCKLEFPRNKGNTQLRRITKVRISENYHT